MTHPAHPHVIASYGHDTHVGFFVTVTGLHGRAVHYDALHGDYAGLAGALAFLARARFFTLDELYAALEARRLGEPVRSPGVRRALDVIEHFKRAADPG